MKKALDYLTAKPARFFLLAALIWGGLMCYLNSKDVGENGFSWHDLLVEANGMVFDLFVFGILLSVYEALREKKEKIERLHEEIDDFRGWDEKEAMYRIVGAIKRLKKQGVLVSEINLTNGFLSNAELSSADLSGANLWGADLTKANLWDANLTGADLTRARLSGAILIDANLKSANLSSANLSGAHLLKTKFLLAGLSSANLSSADLSWADLTGANLLNADFTGATLFNADFSGANLTGANLTGANLLGANLQDAMVGEGWFEKLEKWVVIGREEIIEKYQIDENTTLQLK